MVVEQKLWLDIAALAITKSEMVPPVHS